LSLAPPLSFLRSNQHLELALVFFMQQFRKVYVGDQATAVSKIYAVLQVSLLGRTACRRMEGYGTGAGTGGKEGGNRARA
jgi:hypothetical protein